MQAETCNQAPFLGQDLDGLILTFLSPRDTPNAIFALSTRFLTTKEWTRSLQRKQRKNEGFVIRVHGVIHAEDEPAVLWRNIKIWYKWGVVHREHQPAVEHANGTKEWWFNDVQHRADGPAIERANGTKEWWFQNKRHRLDGPAVEFPDGGKEWWVDDELHRTDGPAVEYADVKEWWVKNELHREDGPAIENSDGSKEWHVNGHEQEKFLFDGSWELFWEELCSCQLSDRNK